jgi:hypothetical protein
MARLYALVSPGGSPGVTTAAVALAMTWPSPVIVAECDPSGGDVLAGALAGHVAVRQGLVEHAIEAGRGPRAAAASLAAQLVPFDASRTRMVLPGLTDPRQAAGLISAWPAVTSTLTAHSADVIADCGRLDAGDGQPIAVLAAACVVAIVLRPTLRQVWCARARIDMLAQLHGGEGRLAIVLNGSGSHSARQVAAALGISVLAALPQDPRTACVLSDGAETHRNLQSGSLMKAARMAGQSLRARGALAYAEAEQAEAR